MSSCTPFTLRPDLCVMGDTSSRCDICYKGVTAAAVAAMAPVWIVETVCHGI